MQDEASTLNYVLINIKSLNFSLIYKLFYFLSGKILKKNLSCNLPCSKKYAPIFYVKRLLVRLIGFLVKIYRLCHQKLPLSINTLTNPVRQHVYFVDQASFHFLSHEKIFISSYIYITLSGLNSALNARL